MRKSARKTKPTSLMTPKQLANNIRRDPQVITDHDTYLELDISTPFHPDQTMLIDKEDYACLKSRSVGRFTARGSRTPTDGIVAITNTLKANGEYSATSSYVHTLICDGQGYLWHRNSNMLDNRRRNLETDGYLPGSITVDDIQDNMRDVELDPTPPEFMDLLTGETVGA